MTDAELVRAVAQEVMGWILVTYTSEDDRFEERFWEDKDGNEIMKEEEWQPRINANHRDMVVEKMVEKGWDMCLEIFCVQPKMAHAHFFKMGQYEMEVEGQAAGPLGRAVLEAALSAERESLLGSS